MNKVEPVGAGENGPARRRLGWCRKACLCPWLFGSVLFLACAASRIEAPPPAPVVQQPADTIPADLDLVVRIDLARVRTALPRTELLSRLEQISDHEPGQALLRAALERADAVWLGVRMGFSLEPVDSVVVLRGRFADFESRETMADHGFRGPVDLGGDWRQYERDSPAPRAAPERVYARHDDLLVFVSRAEIDAVERVLARGPMPDRMMPASRGVLSFAARAPALRAAVISRSRALAQLLDRATRISGHADLTHAGFDAELGLEFQEEDQARRVAEAVRLLLRTLASEDGLLGRIARSITAYQVTSTVVVRLALDESRLAEILACPSLFDCERPMADERAPGGPARQQDSTTGSGSSE